MTRGLSGVSPANVQKFLKGVDYPARKRDLIEAAQENDAPKEIIDLLWDLTQDKFNGVQEVQEAYGELMESREAEEEEERNNGQGKGNKGNKGRKMMHPADMILDFIENEGQADSFAVSQMLERKGYQESATRFLHQMVHDGELIRNSDGDYMLPKRKTGNGGRSGEQQRSQGGNRQHQRGGAQEERAASHKRHTDEELAEYKRSYEERKTKRKKEQDDDDADYDRRLKGHETQAIKDAREMKHGYDGRGRVTDEETDHRLKGNETEAIKDAREMKHGYDGRGRVRKLGPGKVDETIADDRERYEERRARQQGETEVDPETGSHSRRRKNDDGETVRGEREPWQDRYGQGDGQ